MESSDTPQSTASESSNTQETVTATESSNTQMSNSAAPASAVATAAVSSGETPAQPAYTPNWKYKAFGKEYEIDETFRPLVKDAETEKKVRDVFERAQSMNDYKQKYSQQHQTYTQLQKEYTPIKENLAMVGKFIKDGDYSAFLNSFGITDQAIFGWAEKRLEELQLPEHQRQALEKSREAQWQNYQLQQQYSQAQEQIQQHAVETRTMQLDTTLGRPEISGMAQTWDSRMGEGSFRQLVIDEASAHFYATGQDMSVEQALALVSKKFGGWMASQQSAPQTSQESLAQPTDGQAAPTTSGVKPGQKKGVPVIPHVTGKSASPVKKAITNMDELMKRRADLLAQPD